LDAGSRVHADASRALGLIDQGPSLGDATTVVAIETYGRRLHSVTVVDEQRDTVLDGVT
jgi:hypothetical protein